MNEVKTIFTGDASNVFKTADDVDARLQKVGQFDKFRAPAAAVPDTSDAHSKLIALQKEVSKTEAASNKLGDTSATVGRRYEKLNEQIDFQRVRLNQASAAYAAGEINARKYGSTVASVETQIRSLTSRLADANARVRELDAKGLTHFQQLIRGAIPTSGNFISTGAQSYRLSPRIEGFAAAAEAKGHGGGLFDIERSRPFMGAGPIINAAGLRQYGVDETIGNVLVVAARESGLIKTNAEGASVATHAIADSMRIFSRDSVVAAAAAGAISTGEAATASAAGAAAVSQTEFAASATEAAVATEATAVSETTVKSAAESAAAFEAAFAASATEASVATEATAASITVAGVALVPLVATLAVATVAITAAYEFSKRLREEAEKRLKVEESIEAAINGQFLKQKQFQDQLRDQAHDLPFDHFVKDGDTGNLVQRRNSLQKDIDQSYKSVETEMARRKAEYDSIFGPGRQITSDYVARTSEDLGVNPQETAQKQKDVLALNAELDQRAYEKQKDQQADFEKFAANTQRQRIDSLNANRQAELANLDRFYKIQESKLNLHLTTENASQIQSLKAVTNLRNQALADQNAANKKYYDALIEAAPSTEEAVKYQRDYTSSTSANNAEIANNDLQVKIATIKAIKEEKEAYQDLFSSIKSQDNPFIAEMNAHAKAVKNITDNFKELGSTAVQALLDAENARFGTARFGQALDNRLEASDLRASAREFRQGFLNENDPNIASTARYRANLFGARSNDQYQQVYQKYLQEEKDKAFQANLDRQFTAIRATGISAPFYTQDAFGHFTKSAATASDEQQREIDRKVTSLTNGIDPARLTSDERAIAAGAREREAERKDKAEGLATTFYTLMNGFLSGGGLPVSVNGGHLVTIDNKAPDSAQVTAVANSDATAARYAADWATP
jgi:hypothetical protein